MVLLIVAYCEANQDRIIINHYFDVLKFLFQGWEILKFAAFLELLFPGAPEAAPTCSWTTSTTMLRRLSMPRTPALTMPPTMLAMMLTMTWTKASGIWGFFSTGARIFAQRGAV